MNIPKSRQHTKKRIIIVIILITIAVSIGGFIWYTLATKNGDVSQRSERGPTAAEQELRDKSDATQKQEFLDNEVKQGDSDDPQTPPAPTNDDITLTAKTSGENVVVTTKLSTVAAGTCTLTVTGGSTPVTQQAKVIYNDEYSSCAGFSVRKDVVNATSWSISLSVDTGSSKLVKSIQYTP